MFDTKERIINNNLKQKKQGEKLKAVTLVLAPFTINQYGNTFLNHL